MIPLNCDMDDLGVRAQNVTPEKLEPLASDTHVEQTPPKQACMLPILFKA
jgi:hypothetical protein